MKCKLLNMFLYLVLAVTWLFILSMSYLFLYIDDLIKDFCGGLLLAIFIVVYISTIIVPIAIRKKMNDSHMLPLSLLAAFVTGIIINCIIHNSVFVYVSNFTRSKWKSLPDIRYYMIDDLENEHEITGKTEQDILYLLGEPTYVQERETKQYSYYVGKGYIDSVFYDIIFKDGVAIDAFSGEH